MYERVGPYWEPGRENCRWWDGLLNVGVALIKATRAANNRQCYLGIYCDSWTRRRERGRIVWTFDWAEGWRVLLRDGRLW